MPTIKVTNAGEFQTALKNVKSGDTILLGDGNYGATTLRDMPTNVSIKAENEGKAVFGKISVNGDHVSLDGLKVNGGLFGGWIEDLKITNSEIKGTVNFRDVDGLVLEGNDISSNGENMALLLNSVRNFTVESNVIHDAVEDMVRITGNSHNGVFGNNVVRDIQGRGDLHCDLLQMLPVNGIMPRDITIRGNLFYDDPSTGTRTPQGIFLNNPAGEGYKNILIEDNMIATGHVNSIFIAGGEENVVIRNNTLLPNKNDEGGIIRLASRNGYDNSGVVVEANVFKQLVNETRSTIGDNHIYGAGNVDNLFAFGNKAGSLWQDFLPLKGTAVDFGSNMGALDRLSQLLGGDKDDGTVVTPVKPSPVPEPTPAPQPTPQPIENDNGAADVVFELAGRREVTGQAHRMITVEHKAAMEIDSGTVELTFNADTVGWRRGIISKDSKEDGFSAWIDNGKLIVTFDNDKGKVDFGISGIKTKTDYDLKLTFGDGKVGVWLDGELKGEKALDFTLEGNTEKLLLGGYNGRSTSGTTDAQHYFFDGRITDVKISSTGGKQAEQPVNDDDANAVIRKLFDLDNADLNGTKGDVVFKDHKGTMQTDEGSIAFSFDADTVSYNHGLVSKASIEQKDDFSSWISNGKLIVQFQNEKDTIQLTKSGIKAGEDHDVLATFDGDQVQVWLDGKKIGERDFDFDLAQNKEDIAIGAVNFSASGGTEKPQYFFNGTISDVEFYDSVLTPEQLQDIHDGAIQASLV
ncbi:LamG domain-containing protein [Cereibacter sp. SYSU M97828]|nr:LamG domain-containing protein [Cereibacter flavus]